LNQAVITVFDDKAPGHAKAVDATLAASDRLDATPTSHVYGVALLAVALAMTLCAPSRVPGRAS
jgi:hypothetical protein